MFRDNNFEKNFFWKSSFKNVENVFCKSFLREQFRKCRFWESNFENGDFKDSNFWESNFERV